MEWLVDQFIRPPRNNYSMDSAGLSEFEIEGMNYKRRDFELKNPRNLTLQCTIYHPHIPRDRKRQNYKRRTDGDRRKGSSTPEAPSKFHPLPSLKESDRRLDNVKQESHTFRPSFHRSRTESLLPRPPNAQKLPRSSSMGQLKGKGDGRLPKDLSSSDRASVSPSPARTPETKDRPPDTEPELPVPPPSSPGMRRRRVKRSTKLLDKAEDPEPTPKESKRLSSPRAKPSTHPEKGGSVASPLVHRTHQPRSRLVPSRPDRKLCILFLHGSSGCRLDSLTCISLAASYGASLACFDFSGCGMSEGKYVSLGYHEKDDVHTVIEFLRKRLAYTRVILWGVSMGAVSALLYTSFYNEIAEHVISMMILDSPFSSLKKLAEEIVKNQKASGVLSPLLHVAFKTVRKTILKKAGFDIRLMELSHHVKNIHIPALFVHGKEDKFVAHYHSELLCKEYAGKADHLLISGDHNSPRGSDLINIVSTFIWNNAFTKSKKKTTKPFTLPNDTGEKRTIFYGLIHPYTKTKTNTPLRDSNSKKATNGGNQEYYVSTSPNFALPRPALVTFEGQFIVFKSPYNGQVIHSLKMSSLRVYHVSSPSTYLFGIDLNVSYTFHTTEVNILHESIEYHLEKLNERENHSLEAILESLNNVIGKKIFDETQKNKDKEIKIDHLASSIMETAIERYKKLPVSEKEFYDHIYKLVENRVKAQAQRKQV